MKAEGELDLGTEDVLADELNRAVASDARHILLDLSGVTFIDSTGIQLLVGRIGKWRPDGFGLFRSTGRSAACSS